ncbi:hypothetical protein [Streptococcus uberis]|uniref:hypothetical protein n=1 Tax=Streptococcus uberis TaxID=1349 RepID=UPI001C96FDA0|nr:hypothetical protein [Streptococcus uberis]MBY4765224.1 hypothetical protein [Streptococcus uberis]
MFVRFFQELNKPKSEQDFIKRYRFWSRFLLILAILMVALNFHLDLPSYSKGFLIGMSIALLALALRNLVNLKRPAYLHDLYIKSRDERNTHIAQISSTITMFIQILLVALCLILNAFWQIDFNFRLFLIADLYIMLISLFGLTFLLEKYM